MATVEALYKEKTGGERYYGLTREDVVAFLVKHYQRRGIQPKAMLEIGCSSGGTGKLLKQKLGVQYYAGVELMPEAAQAAQQNLDWAMQGNIEEMIDQDRLGEIPAQQYDAILFLDVLEHLYNPWKVVEAMKPLLKPGGVIVASIPNAGNLYVLWKLMRDQFEYEEDGLLDRTHIRFFTLHTIRNLFQRHYKLIDIGTNHNTWSTMYWQQKVFFVLTLGLWKRLFIRQYLVVAEAKGGSNG